MARALKSIVNEVINDSDVVIEVLDARMPNETRNLNIEKRISIKRKTLIFVLNKCDLTNKEFLEKTKHELNKIAPCVFTSTRYRYGITLLKKKLLRYKEARVCVIGYPNTGKSSLINALRGKHSTRTSSIPGFTRSQQWIKLKQGILLIDTPGIIPLDQTDDLKLALINSKHPDRLKDPESVAIHIINLLLKENPDSLKETYNIELKDKPSLILIDIALKRKKLRKGGIPDIELTSKMIILDWQNNKLRLLQAI